MRSSPARALVHLEEPGCPRRRDDPAERSDQLAELTDRGVELAKVGQRPLGGPVTICR
ncbi:hypothetical protein [Streptomyces broussonetiae]|uniref:hypothetical protein n=1 Tax=Streptomyces broussonetiae TaxID=2686304 RepID=UPI0035D57061